MQRYNGTDYSATHGTDSALSSVHDELAACVDRQVLQPAACGLVGIEGLRSVAVFQIGALLELVIADAVHVVIAVGLVAAYLFQLTAEVIGVSDLLLVSLVFCI